MWKCARTPVLTALLCLPALVATAGHGPEAPDGLRDVVAGAGRLTLWPYTTADLATPSDPINLLFPGADPRAIRQKLMALDGVRPPFARVPGSNCTWTDAIGYEQAAYADPAGWVGGAVQLACVTPGAPLGAPFRFHVRLFRSGRNTIGNAHFEFLIPGTAEHEVLSWDLARDFATYDVSRTGVLSAPPGAVSLIPPGFFRSVRRPVYQALAAAGAGELLAALGLALPAEGDAPIPTSGAASALVGAFRLRRAPSRATTTTRVDYSIVVPKPFCAEGPYDFVRLAGPLDFAMTVATDRDGRYERRLIVGGTLEVTPMTPTSPTTFVEAGEAVPGLVFESHRGALSGRGGQVTEKGAQVLLGDPQQSLRWRFGAGGADYFSRRLLCGDE